MQLNKKGIVIIKESQNATEANAEYLRFLLNEIHCLSGLISCFINLILRVHFNQSPEDRHTNKGQKGMLV